MNDTETALSYIPSDDRETWLRMGMALKHEFGDEAWPVWDAWSRQSSNYEYKAARVVWKGFKDKSKPITIGTLYWEARQLGWVPDKPLERKHEPRPTDQAMLRRERERYAAAAVAARGIVLTAKHDIHPYLATKGFPEFRWRVSEDGRLVVPMNDKFGKIQSVQFIDADGVKKFLPHAKASGARFRFGNANRGTRTWYVEGFATALSLRAALREINLQDTVVVCFSAAGTRLAGHDAAGLVIADHDYWRCAEPECKHAWDGTWRQEACASCGSVRVIAPAGEKYARESRRHWWVPEQVGTDLNDMHLADGLDAVVEVIRNEFLVKQRTFF